MTTVQNRGRTLFHFVATVFLASASCIASEVKLTNGGSYDNVTVLRRDANSIEILTQYGRLVLPLSKVESIDGIGVQPALAPAATPQPMPSAATALEAVPGGSPSSTPASSAAPAAPSPVPAEVSATPSQTSSSTAAAQNTQSTQSTQSTQDTPPPPSPLWPSYAPRWNMEFVLGAFAILSAFWVATVAAVQRSLFERRRDPRFWSNTAILLPGLGWVAYEASHLLARLKQRKGSKRTPNEVIAGREKESSRRRHGFKLLDEDRKAILVKKTGEHSGLNHAQDVLEEALMQRASDVHIDPAENEYLIRFRIDGIMQPRMNFDRDEGQRIVSALKSLAQIDIAEKRKAQDGRFRVQTDDNDVDFRVATANSIFGEKVVIRILNRNSGLLDLGDLGMADAMKEQFARVIHSRSGMILATGPTGSGKTSTIYSALSQLDAGRLNIMTIEDPVEYGLTGATQLPVNPKAGTTYESGLRSILRQDPDVIFVGEMRDTEAAQIALRSALTGHLVFSSLHTRDAVGTIIRLEEMGMDRHLLASSLLVVIAQRLLRVLCPICREAYPCRADELGEIGLDLPAGETIYRPKGCDTCGNSGYIGRTGIFEMIVFDDDFREAVNSGQSEAALVKLARSRGFTSFREDGAIKVLLGVTSVEEVLQAS